VVHNDFNGVVTDKPGLHHVVRGRGPRLVLAHGFTQNANCWGPFGHELATDHEVVAVDLPGHGQSNKIYDHADLATAGTLLAEAGGSGIYVGYSMGGRTALHTALQAVEAEPEAIRALVLIGATAGIDDTEERTARVGRDGELADRLESKGLEAFLDGWLTNPLFATLSRTAAAVPQRLENRTEGLAASLRHRGTGSQTPLWERLGQLTIPTLVLVGADDHKFVASGKRLVDAIPGAELATLPAGHAVHLESPTASAESIRRFLVRKLGDQFGEY